MPDGTRFSFSEFFTNFLSTVVIDAWKIIATGSHTPRISVGRQSRLRLTQGGLEVVIRYPLEMSNAAQIDDDMARAMLDAIAKEPRLRLVGSGTPNIQAVVEGQPVV